MRSALQAALLTVLVTGCAVTAWPPDSSFESTSVGALPPLFHAAETAGAGTPASWAVAREGTNRFLRVQTENTGHTYNLCLVDGGPLDDVELAVRLRADSGVEDQGGGLVWAVQDADNYYVTRWNPLENNTRIYKVENGVRHEFQSADTELDPDRWHQLRVVRFGTRMVVFLDGLQVLEHDDATFGAGGVGLWTKADACVSFDGFEVRW
jgi:hypothetical protein